MSEPAQDLQSSAGAVIGGRADRDPSVEDLNRALTELFASWLLLRFDL